MDQGGGRYHSSSSRRQLPFGHDFESELQGGEAGNLIGANDNEEDDEDDIPPRRMDTFTGTVVNYHQERPRTATGLPATGLPVAGLPGVVLNNEQREAWDNYNWEEAIGGNTQGTASSSRSASRPRSRSLSKSRSARSVNPGANQGVRNSTSSAVNYLHARFGPPPESRRVTKEKSPRPPRQDGDADNVEYNDNRYNDNPVLAQSYAVMLRETFLDKLEEFLEDNFSLCCGLLLVCCAGLAYASAVVKDELNGEHLSTTATASNHSSEIAHPSELHPSSDDNSSDHQNPNLSFPALLASTVRLFFIFFSLIGAIFSLVPGVELGVEWRKGLNTLVDLFLAIGGMLAGLPLLKRFFDSEILGSLFRDVLYSNPAVAANMLIAIDMGGNSLAGHLLGAELSGHNHKARDTGIGNSIGNSTSNSNKGNVSINQDQDILSEYVSACILGYSSGVTFSFSIPIGLAMLRRESQRKLFLLGLIPGLFCVPISCLISYLVLYFQTPLVISPLTLAGGFHSGDGDRVPIQIQKGEQGQQGGTTIATVASGENSSTSYDLFFQHSSSGNSHADTRFILHDLQIIPCFLSVAIPLWIIATFSFIMVRFMQRWLLNGFKLFGACLEIFIRGCFFLSLAQYLGGMKGIFEEYCPFLVMDPLIPGQDGDTSNGHDTKPSAGPYGLQVAGSIALLLTGIYPFVYLLKIFLLDKTLVPLGKSFGFFDRSGIGVLGSLASMTNTICLFQLFPDMNEREAVLGCAFMVCGGFVLGDYLVYASVYQPELLLALTVGKLGGGVLAVWLAGVTTGRMVYYRDEEFNVFSCFEGIGGLLGGDKKGLGLGEEVGGSLASGKRTELQSEEALGLEERSASGIGGVDIVPIERGTSGRAGATSSASRGGVLIGGQRSLSGSSGGGGERRVEESDVRGNSYDRGNTSENERIQEAIHGLQNERIQEAIHGLRGLREPLLGGVGIDRDPRPLFRTGDERPLRDTRRDLDNFRDYENYQDENIAGERRIGEQPGRIIRVQPEVERVVRDDLVVDLAGFSSASSAGDD